MARGTFRLGYEKLFNQLDNNNDNVLVESDFTALAQRICAEFDVPAQSPRREEVRQRLERIWQVIQQHADSDGNQGVSRREWVTAARDPEFVLSSAAPAAMTIFDLADHDGDGRLDRQEFALLQRCLGSSEAEAVEAFGTLDADGDGYITRSEYADAAVDYFQA